MMLLASGQDFYNQNSYTFSVTYNGVDYDSTSPLPIAAPVCIDIKRCRNLQEWLQKAHQSVVAVLNRNYQ